MVNLYRQKYFDGKIILLFRNCSYKWQQFVSQLCTVTLQTTEHRIPIVNNAAVLVLVIDEMQRYFALTHVLQFLFCLLESEYFVDVMLNKV